MRISSPACLLGLCLTLVLAGCSDDSGRPAGQTSASASPTQTASPEQTPASTPSPTATASATPTSAATSEPAGPDDVDGDGRKDTITTAEGELSVVLSSTGRRLTAPVEADAPGPAAVLGTADIDRDGRAEVFVQTAQGPSTTFATPYRYDGTALHVVLRDGEPAQLGIGGSVTHGDGFRCTSGGLVEVSAATSEDGKTYEVTVDTLRPQGDALLPVRTSTTTARQGDAVVQRAYTAQCGTVAAGG